MENFIIEKDKMFEITLGALLHDIGKFMQRAFGSIKEIDGDYDIDALESSICPKHSSKGYYSHKHVLFTDAFFDLINNNGIFFFPEGLNVNTIRDIAKYHHKPNSKQSWICAKADRYSSGMDRRENDEPQEYMEKQMFRKIPILSIFNEVIIDKEKFGVPQKYFYDLNSLDPYNIDAVFPKNSNTEKVDDLPQKYKKLWEKFILDFCKIKEINNISPYNFEEILLGLLEKYTWTIPSSTIDTPDISLFDHLKTTAAISSALYSYHMENNNFNIDDIQNDEIEKFRFLAGDLSGIQSTLFTLSHQGVKGVNKILRARSFMLGSILESATFQCIKKLNLPFSSIIQQAGGRFLILVPNISNIENDIDSLREMFDNWMVKNYSGTLSLNLALSAPFKGKMFFSSNLSHVINDVSINIEKAKLKPLSFYKNPILKRDFPFDKECSSCGIRPAQIKETMRCKTCQKEFEIGEKLTKKDILVWFNTNTTNTKNFFDVLGLNLAFVERAEEKNLKNFLSYKNITQDIDSIFPTKYIANYIPKFKEESLYNDKKLYKDIKDDDELYPGMPKSFAHIAFHAKEYDGEKKEYKGKAFLGLLKADVDFLGFIFSYGLKDEQKDKMTLSRVAQLSRMLDLYFTGFLQGLIKNNFPETYTIYAGGDDLLLIGPWRQMLELAKELNKTFKAYTGNNPNINISAGLTLLHSNYPVNRAVEEAEKFLEMAKNNDRNSICAVIDKPMKWDGYEKRLEDAEWIHNQLKNNISASFIYNIMQVVEDAEKIHEQISKKQKIDIDKANWLSRLAYHLARNINIRNKDEKNRKISEWLNKLGIDNLFRIKKQVNIYDWRLPLTIALYRNRK